MDMMTYFNLKKSLDGSDDSDDLVDRSNGQSPQMDDLVDRSNGQSPERVNLSLGQQQDPDQVDTSTDPNADFQSQNIFTSDQPATPSQFQSPSKLDVNALMAQYQPKTAAYDAYTSALGQMPDRSNYQPGTGRKVLAALAGLGTVRAQGIRGGQPIGFEIDPNKQNTAMDNILNDPYNQALGDWQNKMKPLGVAAGLEDKNNVNARIANNNLVARAVSADRANTYAANEASQAKRRDEQTAIAQATLKAKQDAQEYARQNPTFRTFTGRDGFLYFFNPQKPGDKPIKSDVKTNSVNAFDLANLRHTNTLAEIGARGDSRMTVEDYLQANRKEMEDKKEADRIRTKTTPGAVAAKPDTQETTQTVIDPSGNVRTVTKTKKNTSVGSVTPSDQNLPPINLPTGDLNSPPPINSLQGKQGPSGQANIPADVRAQIVDHLKKINQPTDEDTIQRAYKLAGGK